MNAPCPTPAVRFDVARPAVVVDALVITELAVTSEARRWSTGTRSEAAEDVDLADADLTAFVTQALTIGAGAITAAGNAQDTFDLERLVTEVGTRTAESAGRLLS